MDRQQERVSRAQHGRGDGALTRGGPARGDGDRYDRLSRRGFAFLKSRDAIADAALSHNDVPTTTDAHRQREVQWRTTFAAGEQRRRRRRSAIGTKSPAGDRHDGAGERSLHRARSAYANAAAADGLDEGNCAQVFSQRHYQWNGDAQRIQRGDHDGGWRRDARRSRRVVSCYRTIRVPTARINVGRYGRADASAVPRHPGPLLGADHWTERNGERSPAVAGIDQQHGYQLADDDRRWRLRRCARNDGSRHQSHRLQSGIQHEVAEPAYDRGEDAVDSPYRERLGQGPRIRSSDDAGAAGGRRGHFADRYGKCRQREGASRRCQRHRAVRHSGGRSAAGHRRGEGDVWTDDFSDWHHDVPRGDRFALPLRRLDREGYRRCSATSGNSFGKSRASEGRLNAHRARDRSRARGNGTSVATDRSRYADDVAQE